MDDCINYSLDYHHYSFWNERPLNKNQIKFKLMLLLGAGHKTGYWLYRTEDIYWIKSLPPSIMRVGGLVVMRTAGISERGRAAVVGRKGGRRTAAADELKAMYLVLSKINSQHT